MAPKWAALTNDRGVLLYCNPRFAKTFHANEGQHWLASQQDPSGLLHTTWQRAVQNMQQTSTEIALNVHGNGVTPVWCDLYPIQTNNTVVCAVILYSTKYMRTVELNYMHRIRRYSDDNLWIVGEDLRVIWCRVGADDERGQTALGQPATLLIDPADRAEIEKALKKARCKPGQIIVAQAHPSGKNYKAEIDIAYLPNGQQGNRYYVASRKAVPRGAQVVERLMEAYGVKTFAHLAEAMHASKSSITRAARTNDIAGDLLVKCHNATGVSLDWLMDGKGSKERW